MPRKLPPHVERNHVKGHTYLSFRRGKGPRIRLPGDPTSEEFRVAYQAALAGETEPKTAANTGIAPGTIAALIVSYMKSRAYTGLRPTTKAGYVSRIETLRTDHGHRTVAGLTQERINNGILGPYADRPGAALSLLKMLRILIQYAMTLDDKNPCKLRFDPSAGIKRPKTKEIRAWTDSEIAAFERRWPIGTKQRTAYALMLYVGAARVDVHQMTWRQIEEGGVGYTRHKTGVGVDVGLHSELQAALADWPRGHVTIINTEFGKPFTVDGFSRFMRDAIDAAGLPMDCKPHGLRKTLGRRMADAGCSAHEIMAALGHTTLAEAERYTREADRRRGGREAVLKLEAHKANKITQTTPSGLGKTAKNEGKST
ncbi:MAG: tyrosine-type recombinase/integrase [Methylacidiphilales bacterium]|nr:tyrosine-type recombinase/integrase [Candidatus Methylacidiphilales bacterium]